MNDIINSRRRRLALGGSALAGAAGLGLGGALLSTPVMAQGLSTRPVRMILGQTAGTTPDLLARALAPRLQQKWNQPFLVENRGGAGGAIGMDAVAKAAPDGHTITINVNSTLTLPHFFKIDFDVVKSFTPIGLIASNIFALAIHPSVPANNYREFNDWVKKQGGTVNYGSPGNGTHHHMIMESLKLRSGMQMTHIPYKGSAPAFTDLMGGQISAMFVPMGAAIGMARAGKVRILGGSGRERSALTPDIPSLHEQGVKDFHFDAWFAVWGPLGLPADIVRRYNAVFREVLADPEVRELLAKQGTSVVTSTPEELDRLNREEFEKLSKLIKDAGIKGD